MIRVFKILKQKNRDVCWSNFQWSDTPSFLPRRWPGSCQACKCVAAPRRLGVVFLHKTVHHYWPTTSSSGEHLLTGRLAQCDVTFMSRCTEG